METVTTILGGGIRDLLERHPVVPKQYPRIVREVGAGITELLRRQNGERVSFSLSPEEVISLVPRVLGRLSADPDLRKSLETTGNKPLSDDDSSLTRFWPVFRETPRIIRKTAMQAGAGPPLPEFVHSRRGFLPRIVRKKWALLP